MKFLVQNWIFLFVVNWLIISVYSDEVIVFNWIETSPGNWPPASTPQEEFLVFHSEFIEGPLLGLKKTFFDDHKIQDIVELSFKYWASGLSSFRSRNGTSHAPMRDIKLNFGDQWHSTIDSSNTGGGQIETHLKNISIEEWTNFAFLSPDRFTLALKDVHVYYTLHNVAHQITCHMSTGCDNIFDRKLPTSRLEPTLHRYVPFLLEKVPKIEHQIIFTNIISTNQSHKGDFCIDFSYEAKDVPLEVKRSTDSVGIFFPTTPTTSQGNSLPQSRTVCLSWFTPYAASVGAFYFTFGESPIYDIDNHYVADLKLRSSPHNYETTLQEGIYVNHLNLHSQFNANEAHDGWSIEDGSNLTFSKSLSELIHLLPNSENNGYQYHESTLRSKWIHVPNITTGHVQVGFEIDERELMNSRLFSHINVSLTSSAPFRTVWSSRILISTEKSLAVPYGINFGEHYQLSIYAELNVTKITELFSSGQLTGPLELVLESFSVNDPCVRDKTGRPVEHIGVTEFKIETCGNNENDNLGSNGTINRSRCIRDYEKFTSICECSRNFYGEHCQFESNATTTVPTSLPTHVPTPAPTPIPKDPIIVLVTETIAKAEKDLKTYEEIRQSQIVAELNKLKDLLKRYEQGGHDELIGELTAHETRLKHLISS